MTHTHHQARTFRSLASIVCVCALGLSACSQGESASDTSSAAPASSETKEAATSATTTTAEETSSAVSSATQASTSDQPQRIATASNPFTMEDVRVTQQHAADVTLQDIRVGQHEGFDRVVFEYAGTGVPSYLAGYTETPLQQASGNPVSVPGNAYFELIVQGTAGDMMRADEPITQNGSKGLSTRTVQDVNLAAIFEADSQFFIGLDRQRGFHVYTLENPTRIVVDIEAN